MSQDLTPPPLPWEQLSPPLPEKSKIISRQYDLDTLEGIQSIKIPNYKPSNKMIESPKDNIEYILQRKATEHKKNGRTDLAIACLRKSNEIFPYSNYLWSQKDYMRLVEFLKEDGKFEEARKEENKINNYFQQNNINVSVFNKIIQNSKASGTDLVITQDNNFHVCGECAKYTKRIFSISGKDKRFPILPNYFSLNLPEHAYCFNSFYSFWLDFSDPGWSYRGNLISWSNRLFVDERTQEQKAYFSKWVFDNEQEIIDRKNFDFIREHLPEITPKSFGGYRKMKNMQSEKFIKLMQLAKEKGIDLNQKPDLSIYKL